MGSRDAERVTASASALEVENELLQRCKRHLEERLSALKAEEKTLRASGASGGSGGAGGAAGSSSSSSNAHIYAGAATGRSQDASLVRPTAGHASGIAPSAPSSAIQWRPAAAGSGRDGLAQDSDDDEDDLLFQGRASRSLLGKRPGSRGRGTGGATMAEQGADPANMSLHRLAATDKRRRSVSGPGASTTPSRAMRRQGAESAAGEGGEEAVVDESAQDQDRRGDRLHQSDGFLPGDGG